MKEYVGGGTTAQEQYFGLRLCSARMVIECAFGRLKGRFSVLRKAMDINLDDLPDVIYACFVLHNFCELNKEGAVESRTQDSIDYDREHQPRLQPLEHSHNEPEGKRVRRVLTEYLDPWHFRLQKMLSLTILFITISVIFIKRNRPTAFSVAKKNYYKHGYIL